MSTVEKTAKAIKEERNEKIVVIERNVVKHYRAISVLEELGSQKEIQDAIEMIRKRVATLEATAFELMKKRFADLKKA